MPEDLLQQNPQRRLRQLRDVSSARPTEGQILVYNRTSGQWEPSPGNFDEQYYPRDEADATFQPVGSYAPDPHNHDTVYAPLTHAPRHASGGADPVAPADIGAADTAHTHPDYATVLALDNHAISNDHDSRYYLRSETEISHTRIRATSSSSPTLAGTSHGMQVGSDTSDNIAMSDDRIQARNNGNADILYLNPYGGEVRAGSTSSSNRVVVDSEMADKLSRGEIDYSVLRRSSDLSTASSTYQSLGVSISFASAGFWLVTVAVDASMGSTDTLFSVRVTGSGITTPADELIGSGDTGDRQTFAKTWFVYNSSTNHIVLERAVHAGSVTFRAPHTTAYYIRLRAS